MTTDRREEILAQLLVIAADLDGVVATARNRPDAMELARPAIILQDGSEALQDAPGDNRNRGRIQRMELSPRLDVHLRIADDTQSGPLLSLYRTRLIKAIVDDETLSGFVGTSGSIRYDGCTVPEPRQIGR